MKKPQKLILLAGDIICLFVSFFITLFLGFNGNLTKDLLVSHYQPFTILYLTWLSLFYIFELYDLEHQKYGEVLYKKISQAILACLIVSVVFFYFIPFYDITPKTNLFINIGSFGLLFLGWRHYFTKLVAKAIRKKVFIFDKNQSLQSIKKVIKDNPQFGFTIVDDFDSSSFCIFDANQLEESTISQLLNSDKESLTAIQFYESYINKVPLELINKEWLINEVKKHKSDINQKTQRLFDLVLAVIILIASAPVLGLAMALIRLEDGGPVFYTQNRVGIYGKVFKIYKLRSMKVDAEKSGAQWANGSSDNRTTRIGRIIRKLHIDEIPQMINIIKGDLALIGPRAERPEFVTKLEKEIPFYHLRHIIKPGFTGWAQVKFFYANSVADSYEKFQYDLYYIKNRNFFLNLAILFRTCYIILKHR